MSSKKAVRAFVIIMAVLMTFTMIPYTGSGSAYAADDGKETYDKVMKLEAPDSYKDESFEPYGYGVDVPFMMNKQSELLFYQSSPDSSGDIGTFYDKLGAASTGDVLGGKKTSAMKAPPDKLKKAYFVQAVSFDPTGSGRDDHIAFIGIYHDGSKARCYVWAYNTKTRKWGSEFNLGTFDDASCNWMETEHVTDYQAVHFLSITAGDYNADGIDTLVAFASFNGTNGYSQFELKCQDLRISYSNTSSPEGWSFKHDRYTDTLAKLNTIESRMACELETGDFNGDGIDDLIGISYIGSYEDKALRLETYRPIVKIAYGAKGNNEITSLDAKQIEPWSWEEGWWWNSMVSPGISVGDIDKDGMDEIIAAGISCDQKKKSETTSERIYDDIDENHLFVSIIGANEKGNAAREYTAKLDTNAWTRSGFYEDNEDIWCKTAVECAAVNGPGNAELIFINGTLYSYDSKNNKLSAVHTPAYFQNDGDNLSSKSSTNMFIQSTAAGNFDANEKGYEQIAFTVSCKTSGKRSYDYLRGVIGGTKYNSTTGQAGGYYSTSMDKMNDSYSWPGSGKDNASGYTSERQGLNCIVVAADNDNDGFMARYKEKTLISSDPEVLCVLQAPPFFEEVKDYLTDTSGTTYEITESYSYEKTTSDSVSYGVGVVAGAETPAMQMEITAGYALDWSKEFTEGHGTSVIIGYTATQVDLVLVQRKPVVCYYYEIQSQNGEWSGEHMVITVPCEPGLEPMSIAEYNAFAAYYNKQLEKSKYLKDYQNKSGIPDYMKTTHKLDLLNNQWLGHEGDPSGYIKWTNQLFKTNSAYKILQKTPMKFGHNSEAVSWGRTDNTQIGVTESMSHGFTYDATIAMGPNVGAASLYAGLTSSLQYMTGESITTTETVEKGIACTINGLRVKDMPAELKGKDYNFSFKMARWPSGMKHYVNGKAEDIPVYGYALSSVTRPSEDSSISVEDQLQASEVIEKINDLPAIEDITLADESAIISVREKYSALSDSAKKLVDTSVLEALESRIDLLKNEGLDITGAEVKLNRTAFTYNGKVQRPSVVTVGGYLLKEGLDYIIEWSNASSKTPGTYTMTLSGTGLCIGSATVKYTIGKAANTLKAKAKTATVKYSKLKKKNQTLALSKVMTLTSKGQGKLSYKLVSVTKSKYKKYFSVNKTSGKVTIKKKLKKGTYKVKVNVTAAGNSGYKARTRTVIFTIKVK